MERLCQRLARCATGYHAIDELAHYMRHEWQNKSSATELLPALRLFAELVRTHFVDLDDEREYESKTCLEHFANVIVRLVQCDDFDRLEKTNRDVEYLYMKYRLEIGTP